jgi:predicted esterase
MKALAAVLLLVLLVPIAVAKEKDKKKPETAPTVILIGDPKDPNFKDTGPKAVKVLKEKGYDYLLKEHKQGHSMAKKPVEEAFEWVEKTIRASRKKKKKR